MFAASYLSSLTPSNDGDIFVCSRSGDNNFLRSAFQVKLAFSFAVKIPVDSTTISAPQMPQGKFPGSRSAKTLTALTVNDEARLRQLQL